MVVLSPWPVCTTVSPGSLPSRSEIDCRIVGKSEYERPVAPGPPENRVSPLNTTPRSCEYQHTDPGEWPGVCIARNSVPPTAKVSPSDMERKSLSGWVIRHSTSSAGCSSTGASSLSPSSGATVTWSLWPCVHTTATTWRPATASMIGAASCAASNTTTLELSPTSQMLLSTSQLPPSSSNTPDVTTRSIATIRASPPNAAP